MFIVLFTDGCVVNLHRKSIIGMHHVDMSIRQLKRIRMLLLLPLLAAALAGCAPRRGRAQVESHTVLPTLGPLDFAVESPAVRAGVLPAKYTCDGSAATLPLQWRNAPRGTAEFAVVMHHEPGPGDAHWYWVLYHIPATMHALAENSTGVGMLGTNSVNDRTEYAPPCSKGPGPKEYFVTVYALDAAPQFDAPAAEIDRDALLASMSRHVLASAQLAVTYSR
jgi:phosphatidylethanolamine-binding protein (PEBP) family uncharacterized protein